MPTIGTDTVEIEDLDIEDFGVESLDAQTPGTAWTPVCRFADLEPGRGVAALVAGDQVALFRLADGTLRAVGNIDPFSGAAVISRGLTGVRGDGTVTVASPMYKDLFDLATGVALDSPEVALPVYPVRLDQGLVLIGSVAA